MVGVLVTPLTMLYIDILPDAIQQIAIASTLLYFAYRLGQRRFFLTKTRPIPPQDNFYHELVKWLVIMTAILYAEAVVQCTIAMAEEDFPDDIVTRDSKTTQWLKQHSDLFWFVLAFRQSIVMGMLAFELMSETKVKSLVWFGVFPPFIQWHLGLFSRDLMSGAVAGLLFETLTILLFFIYLVKSCTAEHKLRAMYATFANLFYIVSALPVLFLALEMRGPHEVLYLTIFFGCISFFCWSRATVKTPQKSKSLNIDKGMAFTQIHKEDEEEARIGLDSSDATFSIEEDDGKGNE